MDDGIGPTPDIQPPRLRTLLMTDLCGSVTLVERLGDAAAAALFQQHDNLVVDLLRRWNGRQIDRSDGLLLLFGRPIDGLGFALDYAADLRALGQAHHQQLQVRTGLHVGEVLMWRNSEEAIEIGAKPMEIEGLAKPLVARLMQLARPGQILLTSVAASLMRAAARELGERGEGLRWSAHGHWYFKGIPTRQDVFAVAEAGSRPLRAPRSSPKARRDSPWWRRPTGIAAQAFTVLLAVSAAWWLLRPQPAIAFAERDWIVLGDLRNLTGNALLDDSMQQAFRISLEQSRYVNVLSDLKVRDTLQRMQRDPTLGMDRAAATEVAVRDGARAVVLPSIMEVNGKLRVAVEVVDPRTGTTVYSEYADGQGLDSALRSTDQVVAALRSRLGETLQDVSRTSAPLPQVATGNLDALHAYATGMKAYGDRRFSDSMTYFEQAARFDPSFAFAYVGQMRVFYGRGDNTNSRKMLDKAISLKGRLAPRDALYLDAWGAELNGLGVSESAAKWKLLADLYPDYDGAHANRAFALFSMGYYAESEAAASRAAVSQNPLFSIALQQKARAQLARGQVSASLRSFQTAADADGGVQREHAAALSADDQFDAAWTLLDRLPADSMAAWMTKVSVAVDQGDMPKAMELVSTASALCRAHDHICNVFRVQRLSLETLSAAAPPAIAFEPPLKDMMARVRTADGSDRAEWAFMAAATLHLAQRAGHTGIAPRWMPALIRDSRELKDPRVNQMIEIVGATQDHLEGRDAQARQRLAALVDGHELMQVHSMLKRIHRGGGQTGMAERERTWLAARRGLSLTENAGTYALTVLNVSDARQARRR